MGICVCVRMLVCMGECAGMCECKREREKNIVCKWEMGIKTTFLRSELEGLWLEHFFRRLKNRHVDVLESGDRGKRAAGGNLSSSVYYSNHSDSKLNIFLLIVSCYRCSNKCNGWRWVTVTVHPTFYLCQATASWPQTSPESVWVSPYLGLKVFQRCDNLKNRFDCFEWANQICFYHLEKP